MERRRQPWVDIPARALAIRLFRGNAGSMFGMRRDSTGWTVVDWATSEPVRVNDVIQVGLTMQQAKDLVDLLNRIELERDDGRPQ
jgi:hypothetical protein